MKTTHYGTIALVGGDEFGPFCTFDEEILTRVHARRVSLFPTAAAFERPDRAIENGTTYLRSLGVEVDVIEIYSRSNALDEKLAAKLTEAEVLYCIGGSPLHLRSALTATPTLKALRQAWAQGTTLIASSASAMVLGDPMIDPRGGALTIGLGVIPNLAILPHADQRSLSIRDRTIHLVHAPTVMVEIDAQTALVYDHDRKIQVLGQGSVGAFQNGEPAELSIVSDLLDRRTLEVG
ncbi:Type 1 glutamine amidotransferase-like domain-containing protein [Ferrimicrobium acidiphilum]|uniref:Cyanophycinase n=1 Tax=Ferrimicrobium acidiphilum DSM 19497 TaxID=1121877 RepID=A0A0D8FUH3_9ACTN|nr:Type 1 glutamine amidotransferase-like domain-containing protein [Ferrimicrobium acidiphilum]KJE76925.1 cyanophycinase [Ferrimicrobium acidiphilum DSM 19497]MCL5053985.1 Type 1 glutamine amidotransferase-like domain-containing protein [Gammaproteobacteria bacterium]